MCWCNVGMLTGLKIKALQKCRCCRVNNVFKRLSRSTEISLFILLRCVHTSQYAENGPWAWVCEEDAVFRCRLGFYWRLKMFWRDKLIHHASRHASHVSHRVVIERTRESISYSERSGSASSLMVMEHLSLDVYFRSLSINEEWGVGQGGGASLVGLTHLSSLVLPLTPHFLLCLWCLS